MRRHATMLRYAYAIDFRMLPSPPIFRYAAAALSTFTTTLRLPFITAAAADAAAAATLFFALLQKAI